MKQGIRDLEEVLGPRPLMGVEGSGGQSNNESMKTQDDQEKKVRVVFPTGEEWEFPWDGIRKRMVDRYMESEERKEWESEEDHPRTREEVEQELESDMLEYDELPWLPGCKFLDVFGKWNDLVDVGGKQVRGPDYQRMWDCERMGETWEMRFWNVQSGGKR